MNSEKTNADCEVKLQAQPIKSKTLMEEFIEQNNFLYEDQKGLINRLETAVNKWITHDPQSDAGNSISGPINENISTHLYDIVESRKNLNSRLSILVTKIEDFF